MTFKKEILDLYVSVFSRLEKEWTFFHGSEFFVERNATTVVLSTSEKKYFVRLSKGKCDISSYQRCDGIMVLDWSQKGKFKTAQELYNRLNGFFIYLEDYDRSLKRRIFI